MISKGWVFLDENSTTTNSAPLAIINNDMMILQVTSTTDPVGNVSVVVYGKTDLDTELWTALGVVNASSLKVEQVITTTGNYFLPITGISQIYVASSTTAGDTKVYAKLAY